MKTMTFRLLALGDVVGESACLALRRRLPSLRKELGADLVVANGENSAARNGIRPETAELLYAAGVDLVTTGNHVFRRREIYDFLDGAGSLLRPCNFPGSCPGRGYTVLNISGLRVLAVNLLGTLFMEALASPFETMEKILRAEEGKYDFAICDLHAEATSEKRAFACHFDGRLSAVFGTHTHVQTADETVLPGGTGFLTDLGMCGSTRGVLGMKKEIAVSRFLTHMPTPYETETGDMEAQGALFEIDPTTGRCLSVERVRASLE